MTYYSLSGPTTMTCQVTMDDIPHDSDHIEYKDVETEQSVDEREGISSDNKRKRPSTKNERHCQRSNKE